MTTLRCWKIPFIIIADYISLRLIMLLYITIEIGVYERTHIVEMRFVEYEADLSRVYPWIWYICLEFYLDE